MNCLKDYYLAALNGSTLTFAQFLGLWCMGHNYNYSPLRISLRALPEGEEKVKEFAGKLCDDLRMYRETHLPNSEQKFLFFADNAGIVSLVEFEYTRTEGGNFCFDVKLTGPAYNAQALLEDIKRDLEELITSETVAIVYEELKEESNAE